VSVTRLIEACRVRTWPSPVQVWQIVAGTRGGTVGLSLIR
jgi:hypothetical protein